MWSMAQNIMDIRRLIFDIIKNGFDSVAEVTYSLEFYNISLIQVMLCYRVALYLLGFVKW